MKKYPEKLADGRDLLIETLDVGVLGGAEYTTEGVLKRSFRLIREGEGDVPKGTLGVLEGIAAKTDIINKNRRLYSGEVYTLAVGRAQTLISGGNFLGEVDHPDYGTLRGAAVRFTSLTVEGDLVKFTAVILDTEGGEHLVGLLDGGVGVQVSTRGYASSSVEKRTIGGVEVPIAIIGKDLTFEGIDFVLFASNPAGRVTSAKTVSDADANESTDLNTEDAVMTLAELREKHADLVAELETAAREGYVAQADVETQVTAATESARKTALESTEVVARATALSAILEAVKPFLPEAAAAAADKNESDAEKLVSTLTAQVESLTGQVTNLVSEKAEADKAAKAAECAKKEAEAKAEARKAVESKATELLASYEHADLIRDELLSLESEEAVVAAFERHKTLTDAVAARAKVGGKKDESKVPADLKKDEKPEPTKESRLARSIAYDK